MGDMKVTTKEVAEMEGVTIQAVIRWCRMYGVEKVRGIHNIPEYYITDDDLEQFRKRIPQGHHGKKLNKKEVEEFRKEIKLLKKQGKL